MQRKIWEVANLEWKSVMRTKVAGVVDRAAMAGPVRAMGHSALAHQVDIDKSACLHPNPTRLSGEVSCSLRVTEVEYSALGIGQKCRWQRPWMIDG